MSHSERLFSYGTLQYESVQQASFARTLEGHADTLHGYRLEQVTITDPNVLAQSGEAEHPILIETGNDQDRVEGIIFALTPAELAQADAYEVSDYKRIKTRFASGIEAWVYVGRKEENGE